MRAPALAVSVASVALAALGGCSGPVRVDSLIPGPGATFVYSARTNTVMTENADGGAEEIRRDWLAQALEAHGMCRGGYVVYQRDLVIPPQRAAFSGPPPGPNFGNGGAVVYSGSCL